MFKELGLPYSTFKDNPKTVLKEGNSSTVDLPIYSAEKILNEVINSFVPDPNSSHTVKSKSPKKVHVLGKNKDKCKGARKPGRPKNTQK